MLGIMGRSASRHLFSVRLLLNSIAQEQEQMYVLIILNVNVNYLMTIIEYRFYDDVQWMKNV